MVSLISKIEQEIGVSSEGNRLQEFGEAFAIFVSENPVFETLPATTGDGGSLLGKVGEINLFETPTNPEEIRLNLRCAEYAFANFTWKQQLGGSRWAEIAQVAQFAWSDGITEVTEQARILDIVFDLEHNNGHIFDKDPERITGTSQLRPVLDNKFRAHSYRDVLEYGKNTGLLSDKDVKTFKNAFDTSEKLDHAPTQTRSYE